MSWKCPFCGLLQTITRDKNKTDVAYIDVGSKILPDLALEVYAIGCSNPECEEVEVSAWFIKSHPHRSGTSNYSELGIFHLRPDSIAKPMPPYIPKVIINDYNEACKIMHLSPKASATLSRRCIQGMIRDFCKISENTLFKEIDELTKLENNNNLPRGVTPESIEAIDNIRSIGNIGAHMEKDINIIIDIKPNEARILIELIETLFEEWYVSREKRNNRFNKLKNIAVEKTEKKKNKPSSDAEISKVSAVEATPIDD